MAMRVLILPGQAPGATGDGLLTQARDTAAALNHLRDSGAAIEAVAAAPRAARMPACDIVHLFGVADGDAALELALAARAPLVLSPRLSPAWNRSNGTRARVADRVQGNRSNWDFDTGYARTRRALQGASLVIALDEAERKAICDAFLLAPSKVRVVPHGIASRFFEAEPALFRSRARIAGSFALMAGPVSPYANQLGVARALAELALPLVVIGDARERDAGYLRELRALRTVTCLGALAGDDPLLASAHAAASVFVLADRSAGSSMAALGALAAGTPVVGSIGAGLALPEAGCALRHAGWQDAAAALKQAASDLLEAPPAREAVRALVRPFAWPRVAGRLAHCYRELLAQRR
jgi:glycosyltransferase involved in cell wall biosynthesis